MPTTGWAAVEACAHPSAGGVLFFTRSGTVGVMDTKSSLPHSQPLSLAAAAAWHPWLPVYAAFKDPDAAGTHVVVLIDFAGEVSGGPGVGLSELLVDYR